MRTTLPLVIALALAAPVAFVGCDRTVSETTHVSKDSAGNVREESKTVRQDPAGNVSVDHEKKTVTVNP
jgi:hypothetical protein